MAPSRSGLRAEVIGERFRRHGKSGSRSKSGSCTAASCTDRDGTVLVVAYLDNNLKNAQFSHRDLKYLKAGLSLVPGTITVE